jgi:DNA-binding LacI/PurR family transcriptional regulator
VLRENGIEPNDTWQVQVEKGDMHWGAIGVKQLLEQSPEVTAVFFKNDTMACGGMTYLKTMGYDIRGISALSAGMEFRWDSSWNRN